MLSQFTLELGGTALGIVVLILVIVVLIQCGGNKEKESQGLENGNIQPEGAYEKILSPMPDKTEARTTDCEVTLDVGNAPSGENKKRSSTIKSSTSNASSDIADRPKQPTPILPRNTEDRKSSKSANSLDRNAANGALLTARRGPLSATSLPLPNPADMKKDKEDTPKQTEGSFETSGSGEELYTKVKPVPAKEECAYSVVDIAQKDSCYEMVDGNIVRTVKKEDKQKENNAKSEYEVFNAKKEPLDPVLFAVEDSGASGIYEYVPDEASSVAKQEGLQKESDHRTAYQIEGHTGDEGYEQPKKKWGLTRFSLIKRNKSKSQKEKAEKPDSPTSRATFAQKGSNENLSNRKIDNTKQQENEDHKHTSSSRGPRPRTETDTLPPIPPIENLKLKVENRRTLHEGELNRLSPTEMGSRPLAGLPNLYTSEPTDFTGDEMYEVPDREVVGIRREDFKDPNHDLRFKWGSSSASSPKMANREVPKPPKEEPKLICNELDDASFSDEYYDMISSDLHFAKDRSSSRTESNISTDPRYARVNKLTATDEVKFGARTENTTVSEDETAKDGQKFQVLITRTRISSNIRRVDDSEKEIPAIEALADEDAPRPLPPTMTEDSPQPPDDVADLYAKVDMKKKREDEAKRALYAQVHKEKTGIKKYYFDDEVVEVKEEYEDGHYTKIKEEGGNASEYETSEEEKTLSMFQMIRSPQSKRIQAKTTDDSVADDYQDIDKGSSEKATKSVAKSNDDYEIIPNTKVNSLTRSTKPIDDYQGIEVAILNSERAMKPDSKPSDDYEIIPNTKVNSLTRSAQPINDYQDIGVTILNSARAMKPDSKPSDDYEIIPNTKVNSLTRKQQPKDDYQEITEMPKAAISDRKDVVQQDSNKHNFRNNSDDYLAIVDFPTSVESKSTEDKDVFDVQL